MFFFGMDKTLKTYLKLMVKPQIEETTYYDQNDQNKELMRSEWFSDIYASCYIFALVFIPIQKNQMAKPTKQYCDAYDYLFGRGGREVLRKANEMWNDPEYKEVADKMFSKAKTDVTLFTSQLELEQLPDYSILRGIIEENPFLNEIECI